MNTNPLTVSALNQCVRELLEANFGTLLVEGEISNLVAPASGHLYFTLKDQQAQVKAALFRYHRAALGFKLENGMQVIVRATVSLYENRGDYQLIVDRVTPVGDGALHLRFLQLKARLEQLGLFDLRHKKALPVLPQTIGVITSRTGAVIRDILTVLKRRCPGVAVVIYPTLVQGEAAAPQVIQALATANARQECQVLILARGGGSLEDLWTFNEDAVAQAVFASQIPVISAIGHETDFTICDFVADVRAPTPSAAAELAVPNMATWQQLFKNLQQRLNRAISQQLQRTAQLLQQLKSRLRHPRTALDQKLQRLDELGYRLKLAMQVQLRASKNRLAQLSSALNTISPLATLARGYSITTTLTGKVLTSVTQLHIGDPIEALLTDGSLTAVITKTKSKLLTPSS